MGSLRPICIAAQESSAGGRSRRTEAIRERAGSGRSRTNISSAGTCSRSPTSTAARTAYLAALSVQEDHLEARINLGRLLHLDGQLAAAEKLYRQARTSSALLSFNLAILLEDLEREEEAVAAYRDALAQDPLLCDAHFNLSRLHEKANRPREALRHLLAYRRHVARYGE